MTPRKTQSINGGYYAVRTPSFVVRNLESTFLVGCRSSSVYTRLYVCVCSWCVAVARQRGLGATAVGVACLWSITWRRHAPARVAHDKYSIDHWLAVRHVCRHSLHCTVHRSRPATVCHRRVASNSTAPATKHQYTVAKELNRSVIDNDVLLYKQCVKTRADFFL